MPHTCKSSANQACFRDHFCGSMFPSHKGCLVNVGWLILQSAQKEISLWFKSEELADYNVMTKAAIYE
jgi:hypothetical protein